MLGRKTEAAAAASPLAGRSAGVLPGSRSGRGGQGALLGEDGPVVHRWPQRQGGDHWPGWVGADKQQIQI